MNEYTEKRPVYNVFAFDQLNIQEFYDQHWLLTREFIQYKNDLLASDKLSTNRDGFNLMRNMKNELFAVKNKFTGAERISHLHASIKIKPLNYDELMEIIEEGIKHYKECIEVDNMQPYTVNHIVNFLSQTEFHFPPKPVENQLSKEPDEKPNKGLSTSNIEWKKKETNKKIELIRVIIALYDLDCFDTVDNSGITQEKVLQEFGKFLNIDLTDYSTNLSKGLEKSEQANLEIFERMKDKIKERMKDQLERRKK